MSQSFSNDKILSVDGLMDAFSNLSVCQKALFIKYFIFKLPKEELSMVIKYTEQRQKDGIGDLISEEVKENINNHDREQGRTVTATKDGLLLDDQNDSPMPLKRTKSLFGKKYRPYPCDICNKTFKWNKDLLIHQQTDHAGKRAFTCEDCPKALKRSSSMSLKIHKRDNASEKNLTCDSCSKIFLSRRALMKHEMAHTKDGSFSCNQCSKSFLQVEHLKNHKKIHAENKNYIFMCDNCPKTFYDAENLVHHKLSHCRKKLCLCPVEKCLKTFKTQFELKKHLFSDHSQIHICDYCKKTFSESFLLKAHLRKCGDVAEVFIKSNEEYHSIKIDNVGTKLPVSKSLARLSSVLGFS